MQAAGLIMKIVGGLVLWIVITIVFFRWYNEEEGPIATGRRTTDDLDRELRELMGLTG